MASWPCRKKQSGRLPPPGISRGKRPKAVSAEAPPRPRAASLHTPSLPSRQQQQQQQRQRPHPLPSYWHPCAPAKETRRPAITSQKAAGLLAANRYRASLSPVNPPPSSRRLALSPLSSLSSSFSPPPFAACFPFHARPLLSVLPVGVVACLTCDSSASCLSALSWSPSILFP